jgi:uncharacterized membrane protein YhaH (DUF805 family)
MATPSLLDAPTDLLGDSPSFSQLLFSLEGRVSRRTFWRIGVLGLLALAVVLTALLRIAGMELTRAETLTNLLLCWPAIAISVKRWHDRGRSGYWVLINLVPVIGWLWAVLDNGFVRSDVGPNAYGPPPHPDQRLL